MQALAQEGRAPGAIVLENVCGALSSYGGLDFKALVDALAAARYRYGALVIDAVHFVPQSRPRLHLDVAGYSESLRHARRRTAPALEVVAPPQPGTADTAILRAHRRRVHGLPLAHQGPDQRLVDMMGSLNRRKLIAANRSGRRVVGAIYKEPNLGQEQSQQEYAFSLHRSFCL